MTCGIYMIMNNINKKKYIGQSRNIEYRWNQHKSLLNRNKHHNKYLQNSWNKYGESVFDFIIIEECHKNILNDRERYWIDYYNTFYDKKHYNLTLDGDSRIYSKEVREKISKSRKGQRLTESTKRKLSEANKGKKLTQQHKEKISKALKGKKNSENHNKNISKARKGIKFTESHKRNLSKAHKGNKHTEATKRKMSESRKGKKLYQFNLTGYYRVGKKKSPSYKQGFCFAYTWFENGKPKSLYAVSLEELKKKVIARGLEWRKV